MIAYKEAFFDEESKCLCIVLEYADGGDLMSKVDKHKKSGTSFSESEIWTIFIQMLQGVNALHESQIVHRDLKCANVFSMRDGKIKLGDLNVSKVC